MSAVAQSAKGAKNGAPLRSSLSGGDTFTKKKSRTTPIHDHVDADDDAEEEPQNDRKTMRVDNDGDGEDEDEDSIPATQTLHERHEEVGSDQEHQPSLSQSKNPQHKRKHQSSESPLTNKEQTPDTRKQKKNLDDDDGDAEDEKQKKQEDGSDGDDRNQKKQKKDVTGEKERSDTTSSQQHNTQKKNHNSSNVDDEDIQNKKKTPESQEQEESDVSERKRKVQRTNLDQEKKDRDDDDDDDDDDDKKVGVVNKKKSSLPKTNQHHKTTQQKTSSPLPREVDEGVSGDEDKDSSDSNTNKKKHKQQKVLPSRGGSNFSATRVTKNKNGLHTNLEISKQPPRQKKIRLQLEQDENTGDNNKNNKNTKNKKDKNNNNNNNNNNNKRREQKEQKEQSARKKLHQQKARTNDRDEEINGARRHVSAGAELQRRVGQRPPIDLEAEVNPNESGAHIDRVLKGWIDRWMPGEKPGFHEVHAFFLWRRNFGARNLEHDIYDESLQPKYISWMKHFLSFVWILRTRDLMKRREDMDEEVLAVMPANELRTHEHKFIRYNMVVQLLEVIASAYHCVSHGARAWLVSTQRGTADIPSDLNCWRFVPWHSIEMKSACKLLWGVLDLARARNRRHMGDVVYEAVLTNTNPRRYSTYWKASMDMETFIYFVVHPAEEHMELVSILFERGGIDRTVASWLAKFHDVRFPTLAPKRKNVAYNDGVFRAHATGYEFLKQGSAKLNNDIISGNYIAQNFPEDAMRKERRTCHCERRRKIARSRRRAVARFKEEHLRAEKLHEAAKLDAEKNQEAEPVYTFDDSEVRIRAERYDPWNYVSGEDTEIEEHEETLRRVQAKITARLASKKRKSGHKNKDDADDEERSPKIKSRDSDSGSNKDKGKNKGKGKDKNNGGEDEDDDDGVNKRTKQGKISDRNRAEDGGGGGGGDDDVDDDSNKENGKKKKRKTNKQKNGDEDDDDDDEKEERKIEALSQSDTEGGESKKERKTESKRSSKEKTPETDSKRVGKKLGLKESKGGEDSDDEKKQDETNVASGSRRGVRESKMLEKSADIERKGESDDDDDIEVVTENNNRNNNNKRQRRGEEGEEKMSQSFRAQNNNNKKEKTHREKRHEARHGVTIRSAHHNNKNKNKHNNNSDDDDDDDNDDDNDCDEMYKKEEAKLEANDAEDQDLQRVIEANGSIGNVDGDGTNENKPKLPCGKCCDDPMNIGSPKFMSIFRAQKLRTLVIRWIFAFIGRMFYNVNEVDKWQVMFLIIGLAGTGKSIIMAVICAFFSRAIIGIVDDKVEFNFPLQAVWHCEVMLGLDLGRQFGHTFPQTVLQQCITGERIHAAIKGHAPKDVDPWIAHFFAVCNNWPDWRTNGGAMSRRVPTTRFDEYVQETNTLLLEEILREELPRIMAKSVLMYHAKVFECGIRAVINALPFEFRQEQERFSMQDDPVAAFIVNGDDCEMDPNATTGVREFRIRFQQFCQSEGIKKRRFDVDLWKRAFKIHKIREEKTGVYDDMGNKGPHFVGVRLKDFRYNNDSGARGNNNNNNRGQNNGD